MDNFEFRTFIKIFSLTKINICFVLIIYSSILIGAQTLHFSQYTSSQGLISNTVLSMCQNSDGRLWIGTSDGISVYDGQSFKSFTTLDGLSSSMINSMLVDKIRKGVVWIGTNGGGINKYEDGHFHIISLGKSDASNRVNYVTEDGKGVIWAATDNGVYSVNENSVMKFKPELFTGGLNTIAAIGEEIIVPLQNKTICFFNTQSGSFKKINLPLQSNEIIWSISIDKDNTIWVGTNKGSLFKIHNYKWKKIILGDDATVLFVAKDFNNDLWVGTGDGIVKFQESNLKEEDFTRITEANGLPGRNINCGLIDTEGELWFGLWEGGIVKLANDNIFTVSVDNSSVISNNSKSIMDLYNHIWCVEKKGLLEIWKSDDGQILDHFHKLSQIKSNDELEIIKIDNHGKLIIGTNFGKIIYYQIIHSKEKPSQIIELLNLQVPYDNVAGNLLYIFQDKNGRLWCSVNTVGVCTFNPFNKKKNFHLFTLNDGLPGKSIRVIYEDNQNHFWFGGFGKGLAEFIKDSKGKWSSKLFTHKDGLPDNSIRSITEDSKGILWIGTRYGGIARMEKNHFQIINTKNGIQSDGVWCFKNGTDNNMMIGTQLGLQNYVEEKKGFHLSTLVFGQPVYSCGQTTNGLVWASSDRKITIINLQGGNKINIPPKIFITSVLVNGRKLKMLKDSDFSYNQNTFTFDFAGISLRYGASLQYEYMLNGAEDIWHKINDRHSVTYALLKPGNYSFKVKAINPNGKKSIKAAVFLFSISPPLWFRWWFISALILVLATGIFLIVKIRINRLLEIERVKGRIATDLHDDIGSGLTRIAIAADVALKQIAALNLNKELHPNSTEEKEDENYSFYELIKKIGKHARELVDSMSDVVWSIDPKHTKLSDLSAHLRQYVFDICETKNISLEFSLSEKIMGLEISPEVLRAILLIAKEASNNAVKHSNCRRLQIELSTEENKILLNVFDDGKGFKINEITLGYGLLNMKKRCESTNGLFNVETSESGTVISAIIPFK